MADFYLTLPSNSLPSTNTTASFSIYLPNKIDLQGKWEVALVEIQYPFSWNNLTGKLQPNDQTDNWISVRFSSGKTENLLIPAGYYETIQDLEQAIEYAKEECSNILDGKVQALKRNLTKAENTLEGKELGYFMKSYKLEHKSLKQQARDVLSGFRVVFNHTLKRIKVKVDPHEVKEVGFSTHLQYMLGLQEAMVRAGEDLLGKYIPDLNGGFYALHVYCNLVEPQIVGSTTAPLLRLVNIEGRHGSIVEKMFQAPHYVPVNSKEISRIDIEIKDDNNNLVPFDFGKAVVKLHFRKRRLVL